MFLMRHNFHRFPNESLEQFSSVLLRDAPHKYAGCTSVVELFTSNYNIPPATPSDALGLSSIFWKFITEQVVEVRSGPLRVDHEDLCFHRLCGWLYWLFADGQLMELLNEDIDRDRGSLGTHLCQLVGLVVVVPEHMR